MKGVRRGIFKFIRVNFCKRIGIPIFGAKKKLWIMEKRNKKYKVKKSCEKYKSYDPNVWSLEFFDPKTGGYVVVNRKRRSNAIKFKNEGTKYDKELAMVKVFACGGHQIEMLEEISRIPSPDVMIDGIPADLKFTRNEKNIVDYAEKAVKEKGARIVLFEIPKRTDRAQSEFNVLTKKKTHGMYFVSGNTEIYTF